MALHVDFRVNFSSLAALLLASGLSAVPGLVQAAGNNMICCQVDGRKVCGDSMPAQCIGKAYSLVNDRGIVIRHVDAPKSEEQKEQDAIVAKKKRDAELAEKLADKEQQRRDRALLDTYGSEKDIDVLRARAEQDVTSAIKQAEARVAESQKRKKKLEAEAEFYKNKPLPDEVRKGIKESEFEIKAQQELIDVKQKDLLAVRAKYDAEKRRYRELTGGK